MRNISLLIFFFLLLTGHLFSQNPGNGRYKLLVESDCSYTKPDTNGVISTAAFPYKTILISDARPDTTRLGYIFSHNALKLSRICTNDYTAKTISSFFSRQTEVMAAPEGDSIFAYLKNLWISNDEKGSTHFVLAIKVEFYLKKEACFYPLYRFDSSFTLTGYADKTPGLLLSTALKASIRKLYTVANNTSNRRCISVLQIDSFNNPLKYAAILRDETIKKGVYMNFKQFRGNNPAYPDFKISSDEIADIVYVRGKMLKDSAITDAWGFSDGEKIFIRLGNNFFPLHRTGNSFEFFGYGQIQNKQVLPFTPNSYFSNPAMAAVDIGVRGLLSNINSRSKDLNFYQLDMETGRVVHP